jgi:ABC-type uncharacterized transport system permease subunit
MSLTTKQTFPIASALVNTGGPAVRSAFYRVALVYRRGRTTTSGPRRQTEIYSVIPVIGTAVFEQVWLQYAGVALIIVTALVLRYTSIGLAIHAARERYGIH